MVELAVVLPVLLLVILGIIDFSRFFNYSNQQTQLAAQAARWAAVNSNPGGSSTTLQSYVASQAQGGLNSASGDVTSAATVYIYYPSGSSNAVGNPVRACVVSQVKLLPLIDAGSSLTITESATSRIEQADTTAFTTNTPPSSCPTS